MSSKIASSFFCEMNFSNSSLSLVIKPVSRWALLKNSAVPKRIRKARHSTAKIVILSSTVEVTEASISDNLFKISRTTSSVIISNCFPIEFVNESGIVRINSYTSYAKKMENGVYNASRYESNNPLVCTLKSMKPN